MKQFAKMILKMFFPMMLEFAVGQLSEDEIRDLFKDFAGEYIKKHFTIDEITSEVKDVGKWFKDKF